MRRRDVDDDGASCDEASTRAICTLGFKLLLKSRCAAAVLTINNFATVGVSAQMCFFDVTICSDPSSRAIDVWMRSWWLGAQAVREKTSCAVST